MYIEVLTGNTFLRLKNYLNLGIYLFFFFFSKKFDQNIIEI